MPTPLAESEDAPDREPAAPPKAPKAPWRLLARDQTILYALCLVLLAALALRYAIPRRTASNPVRKLRRGDQIDYRVDINRAGPAELDLLPGIGPSKAADIIAYREAHGPFKRISELANIRGISPRAVEKLRELITLHAPPQPGEPPR